MADVIIITALAMIAFFVVRNRLHKLRRGQCGGSCARCTENCAGCRAPSGLSGEKVRG